ncbi:DUF1549 and DUF1553 domain-containing protein [Tuwongella immobilis]|uniref:BIG2 domain-containing protein n=1 Tax=Tuwongella immobilis TaxID=692036 RepID=A0A6C2YQ23_9BACT|nr:DUF1549 and DUF1553 domain-containing protein [Tuwongella immobilis]VIP03447.1 Ig-like domain-containing protein OS=Singulisphaera acidiphila (strain ATCC BAA-1392 / DSM 18658 / VKM B-2454 / MOB10) GN=Sinac_2724 PE=4 SV=1: PSCyt2: PSD1 [Tuwongella immobilis]VTS04266.1 Ig-like domain-containing protein OS=Singulisphaera acidiphila (strain ATCC BAA-1392 / DSM 18658 / VKM B-2454 / MOB10) GN=Sinac_2724 PE=4 SV=1: PSCyt2: PSD1 [Tuwongella immobilis]
MFHRSRFSPVAHLSTWLAGLVVSLVLSQTASAGVPTDPAERAAIIGTPVAIQIFPESIVLSGARATEQVLITGTYADQSVRDLTHVVTWKIEHPQLVRVQDGWLRPMQNGTTTLRIEAAGKTAQASIRVEAIENVRPISFRHDVIAALNFGGCNMGACHGTPSGKNGFKLSLRGFDPAADYLQLTRDILGRRTDRLNPMASLLLQKGMGKIPHEGGARFGAESLAVEVIERWLGEGSPDDPTTLPKVVKLDVTPGTRILHAPSRWQQLSVRATFSDGTTRDVTRLCNFSTSDAAVGDVNANGLVQFSQSGEVAILCRYLEELVAVRLMYLEPKEGFAWSNPPQVNYVDQHVFAKLRQMNILPSDLCSDSEFIRRATLDLCGMLPTPTEVQAFLADASPNKREKLIDALLARPEYADFWTLKWSDVLRSSRKAIQLKGALGFQSWLRDHLASNTPFDRMVREMLTSNGSTFANPPANFYRIARDPQNLAETTAQLFFGIRMQCAKCHNHPFERWTQDDYYSMAAWFARVRQKKDQTVPGKTPAEVLSEVVFTDRAGEVTQPRTGKVMAPKFLGAEIPAIAPTTDRREVLADWLASGRNPFFAKSVVNRIWFHLLGRGIVDPVDDFRDSNPSSNDDLLNALAADFVAKGFDMKQIIRTIMLSRTYQLSAETNATNQDDSKYFSHAVTKLLSAEQLLDALGDVTGIREKFAGLPNGTRAIQLPDGEVNHPFLKTFGQPARELACECERESDSNLAQALQLINGPTINEKIRNPENRIGKAIAAKLGDSAILDELYLSALSRLPNVGEKSAALAHISKATDKRKAWEDVMWALLNTREFLFRH